MQGPFGLTGLAGVVAGQVLRTNAWLTANSRATSASQPSTAVFLCRALHPAIRSTAGGRSGR